MRLLLIRHGQTASNVGRHLDTAEPGAELTDLGRAQAAAIPGALRAEEVGLVVVSSLRRTHQTAAPLLSERGLTPLVRPGAREISAGEWEMLNDEISVDGYLTAIFGWMDDLRSRIPGGETGEEVFGRFDDVVDEAWRVVGDDGTAVIVSHGAMMRSWSAARVDGVDFAMASRRAVPNTGLIRVLGEPGAWALDHWGERPLGEE